MILWLPPLALALDLLLADPRRLPHPVQAIGFLAGRLEAPARRLGHPLATGGLVLVLLLALVWGACTLLLHLPWGLGTAAAVYMAWSGLALGGLLRDGKEALDAVMRAQSAPPDALPDALRQARHAVQMLVSRDCAAMSPDDLCRSLAESLSENFNDAFVAPYFWLCLGGPAALWLYKTASTLDSMWGYKTERWLYFGRAGARLDDLLAYVPARLSALLLYLTALLRNNTGQWPGWRVVAREASLSASPNAGWPMAAAAWLFAGRTGGPTVYHGNLVHKPCMGPGQGRWNADNTAGLIRHMRRAGLLGSGLAALITALCMI